jgi:membrane protein involved in colicin uptake
MELEELAVHERAITNRGQGVRMDRRWVQASYASAEAAAAEEVAAAGRTVAKEEAAAAATEREEAAAAVGACDRTRLEDFMLELLEEGRVAPRELLTRLTSRRVKQSEDFAHLHLNLQDFDEDF